MNNGCGSPERAVGLPSLLHTCFLRPSGLNKAPPLLEVRARNLRVSRRSREAEEVAWGCLHHRAVGAVG